MPANSLVATWAKSAGLVVAQLFKVTAGSSGELNKNDNPAANTPITKSAIKPSLMMSYSLTGPDHLLFGSTLVLMIYLFQQLHHYLLVALRHVF